MKANTLGELIEYLSKRFDVSYAKLARIVVKTAKWQKEQMLKDAVEADIMLTLHDKTGDISLHTGYLPKELGIKCNDKVKIVIVKEDKV